MFLVFSKPYITSCLTADCNDRRRPKQAWACDKKFPVSLEYVQKVSNYIVFLLFILCNCLDKNCFPSLLFGYTTNVSNFLLGKPLGHMKFKVTWDLHVFKNNHALVYGLSQIIRNSSAFFWRKATFKCKPNSNTRTILLFAVNWFFLLRVWIFI